MLTGMAGYTRQSRKKEAMPVSKQIKEEKRALFTLTKQKKRMGRAPVKH